MANVNPWYCSIFKNWAYSANDKKISKLVKEIFQICEEDFSLNIKLRSLLGTIYEPEYCVQAKGNLKTWKLKMINDLPWSNLKFWKTPISTWKGKIKSPCFQWQRLCYNLSFKKSRKWHFICIGNKKMPMNIQYQRKFKEGDKENCKEVLQQIYLIVLVSFQRNLF